MNLEPGDLVVIDDGYNSTYTIKEIRENEIEIIEYSQLSTIVRRNGQWMKGLDPVAYFQKRSLDWETMLQLPDRELDDICLYNLTPICNNEEFWFDRIRLLYGDLVAKYKPNNETYKQQYYLLNNYLYIDCTYVGAKTDRIDFALAEVRLYKSSRSLVFLMTTENIEIWDYIKPQIIGILSSSESAHELLTRELKTSAILYWMLNQKEIISNEDILRNMTTYAAKLGNLEILKILAGYGIYPHIRAAEEAINNNHINVVRWILDNKEMISNEYVLQDMTVSAASLGNLIILNLLFEYEIYPDVTAVRLAIYNNHINVIKWMANNNLINKNIVHSLTTINTPRYILNSNHILEVYEILSDNNLLDEEDLTHIREWATQLNRFDVLAWVESFYSRYP